MSKSTTAIGSLALALTVGPARGQAQAIRPHFGVGAGITVPTGDYHADAAAAGEGFAAGWQGTVLVEFKPHCSRVGLRVDGTYGQNGANDKRGADLAAAFGGPVDEKIRLLGWNADVTYDFPSSRSVQPYVLAGIERYNMKLSMTFSTGGGTDTAFTKFGWNAGAGVRHSLGRRTVFVETRYSRLPRILNEGRYYKGTFYHANGIQVQHIGLTAGIRFG